MPLMIKMLIFGRLIFVVIWGLSGLYMPVINYINYIRVGITQSSWQHSLTQDWWCNKINGMLHKYFLAVLKLTPSEV